MKNIHRKEMKAMVRDFKSCDYAVEEWLESYIGAMVRREMRTDVYEIAIHVLKQIREHRVQMGREEVSIADYLDIALDELEGCSKGTNWGYNPFGRWEKENEQ